MLITLCGCYQWYIIFRFMFCVLLFSSSSSVDVCWYIVVRLRRLLLRALPTSSYSFCLFKKNTINQNISTKKKQSNKKWNGIRCFWCIDFETTRSSSQKQTTYWQDTPNGKGKVIRLWLFACLFFLWLGLFIYSFIFNRCLLFCLCWFVPFLFFLIHHLSIKIFVLHRCIWIR